MEIANICHFHTPIDHEIIHVTPSSRCTGGGTFQQAHFDSGKELRTRDRNAEIQNASSAYVVYRAALTSPQRIEHSSSVSPVPNNGCFHSMALGPKAILWNKAILWKYPLFGTGDTELPKF